LPVGSSSSLAKGKRLSQPTSPIAAKRTFRLRRLVCLQMVVECGPGRAPLRRPAPPPRPQSRRRRRGSRCSATAAAADYAPRCPQQSQTLSSGSWVLSPRQQPAAMAARATPREWEWKRPASPTGRAWWRLARCAESLALRCRRPNPGARETSERQTAWQDRPQTRHRRFRSQKALHEERRSQPQLCKAGPRTRQELMLAGALLATRAWWHTRAPVRTSRTLSTQLGDLYRRLTGSTLRPRDFAQT
jgi:hypothetical protein